MIYQPREDSLFLSEVVKKFAKKNIKILDLGTGSGIQSKNLLKSGVNKKFITASDIDKKAIDEAKKLGIKVVKSDLFSNIKNKFDLIIFNPPYLPKNKFDDEKDTTGGKKGDEVIIKFIKQLKKHLNHDGKVLLLTSSLTPNKNWMKLAKDSKFKVKKIDSKKLFFEELYIWFITLQ